MESVWYAKIECTLEMVCVSPTVDRATNNRHTPERAMVGSQKQMYIIEVASGNTASL